MTANDVSVRVARLRREFDETFARPRVSATADAPVDYVLVRVGEAVHAVSSGTLRTIAPCPPIVEVPSRAPALVGIAASQGTIIGVYALADLLGFPRTDAGGRGWMLVLPDGQTGLVVDGVAGHVRAGPDSLRADSDARADALVVSVLELNEGSYPVIDVAAVTRRIAADSPTTEKE